MSDRLYNFTYTLPEPPPLSDEQVKSLSERLEGIIYEGALELLQGSGSCTMHEMQECVHKSYDKCIGAVNLDACP